MEGKNIRGWAADRSPNPGVVEAAGIEPASGRFDRRCLQAYPVFRSPAGPPTGKVSGRPAPSGL